MIYSQFYVSQTLSLVEASFYPIIARSEIECAIKPGALPKGVGGWQGRDGSDSSARESGSNLPGFTSG